MIKIIKISSVFIILLGIVHVSFALPFQLTEDTLWFVGSGFAVLFSGLLNLVAIDRGGSVFTKIIAAIVNAVNTVLFFAALKIIGEPQVYLGIALSSVATFSFISVINKKV